MKPVDIWFAKFRGKTYFTFSQHEDAPLSRPIPVKSVGSAIRAVKEMDCKVVQIGICTPDMIGL